MIIKRYLRVRYAVFYMVMGLAQLNKPSTFSVGEQVEAGQVDEEGVCGDEKLVDLIGSGVK
ncbi:MAG: hypothetical protein OQL16_02130 [Gammaproteobacteria bacterium]|nr:hypothetical protein [Gammaproteobacteria bacterium]